MADNYINVIEGLDKLHKLRELSLARNDISQIGDALSTNSALTHLNLADNNIGSFKVWWWFSLAVDRSYRVYQGLLR